MANNRFNLEEFDEVISNDYKYCKKCKTETVLNAKFCQNCGHNEFYSKEELNKKENSKYCSKCKTLVSLKTKFCQNCGNNEFVKSLDEVFSLDDLEIKYQKEFDVITKEINNVKKSINNLLKNKDELEKKLAKTEVDFVDRIKCLKQDEENYKLKSINVSKEIKDFNIKIENLNKEINDFDDSIDDTKLIELKTLVKKETTNNNSLIKKLNKLIEEKEKYERIKKERNIKLEQERLAKEKEEQERLAKLEQERLAKEKEEQERLEKLKQEKKAKELFLKLAEIRALKLAEEYENAIKYYKEKKYDNSIKLFRELDNQKHADSSLFLGIHYYKGLGTHADYNEALKAFLRAKDNKIKDAYYWLGLCYEYGKGVPINLSKAFDFYKTGGNIGSAISAYQTYICYRDGIGVRKDKKQALHYLEEAAKGKHFDAVYEAGLIYYKKKKYSHACFYFNISQELNNPDAMNYMGHICRDGHMGNIKDALKWYEKASDLGCVDATYNRACELDKLDKYDAKKFYVDAANKGHKKAQLKMSKLYKKGDFRFNIKKDIEMSKSWLKKYKEK